MAIEDDGVIVDEGDIKNPDMDDDKREDVQKPVFRGGPDKLPVSRKAVAKYGITEGCAACIAIKRLGHR